MSPVAAQAAVSRTGKALRASGTDDAFRAVLGDLANTLDEHSTNYGALRRRYGPDPWLVPDVHWDRMRHEMTSARLGRSDTDWDRRRTACSVWLWARLTAGDPALSPVAAGRSGSGRSCTNGLLGDVTAFDRHRAMTRYLTEVWARLREVTPV